MDTKKKYKVFIGNIDNLNKLDNVDIENLIDNFNQTANINLSSIQVFKDSIHVELENEQDAVNLANFFNNFIYKKTNKLKSFVICNDQKLNHQESSKSSKINRLTNNNNNNSDIKLIDCEIYVLNRQLKKYADSVNDKLCKELFGLRTQIKYLSDDNDLFEIKYDFFKKSLNNDLLYLVYLNEKNEQFNSINLFILNKWRLDANNNKNGDSDVDHLLNKQKYSIKGIFIFVILEF